MLRRLRSGRAPAIFFPTRATHTASDKLACAAALQDLELSEIALRKAMVTASMRKLEIEVALREVELGAAKAKASAAEANAGDDTAARALQRKLDLSKALLQWSVILGLAGAYCMLGK